MNEAKSDRPRARARRNPAPTTLDAIDSAMQAERHDEAPDSPARQLLLKHARLLDRQTASETMSLVLKTLTGVVGLVVAVALGSLMWSASNERGLVIEPFSVPPEFARRGITGQVVASRLLDRLSEMGEQTVSVRAPSTYANNWNGDIKVQIPQTGVSVGELRRYLVEWLGHQTSIGGELYQTPTGLVLSARTGTAAAATQTGTSEADLDRMIAAAAESVYATTQPYRHAIYLGRSGSLEDIRRSKEALLQVIRNGDEADRMWGYTALNLRLQAEGDNLGAIRAADSAIAMAPLFNLAYANRAGAHDGLGHSEAAYRDKLMAERTVRSDGARYMRESGLAYATQAWRAVAASDIGDYQTALDAYRLALLARPGDEDMLASVAWTQLAQHTPRAAVDAYSALSPPAADADVAQWANHAAAAADFAAEVAAEDENWAEAARLMRSVDESNLLPAYRARRHIAVRQWTALLLARSGDLPRAQALIARTPTDCYRCVMRRGAIAALAGDVAGADRWFANAVRQGPSLPFAEFEWARAKLERHDVDGAIALFQQAHRKGPRWADPLKYWGDALVLRRDYAAAAGKYAEAAERAPRWGALQLAWGQALAQQHRNTEAQAHYRVAATTDLSAKDRRLLVKLQQAQKS
jgi:tetratricopeptide (TPR) repeat protein